MLQIQKRNGGSILYLLSEYLPLVLPHLILDSSCENIEPFFRDLVYSVLPDLGIVEAHVQEILVKISCLRQWVIIFVIIEELLLLFLGEVPLGLQVLWPVLDVDPLAVWLVPG